jgi:archaemetzincin
MAGIALVPIYLGGLGGLAERRGLLDRLAARLEAAFGLETEVRHPWFDPERAFDPSRGQYNSTLLLAQLQPGPPGAAPARVLGLTGVDLFIPVLSWVFGEAQLPGPAAVVSLHRLSPEIYGLPADEERLAERAEKEAIHELGHTFGLVHCRSAACVMRASTYAEEIDHKPARFCAGCLAALRDAVAGDAAARSCKSRQPCGLESGVP